MWQDLWMWHSHAIHSSTHSRCLRTHFCGWRAGLNLSLLLSPSTSRSHSDTRSSQSDQMLPPDNFTRKFSDQRFVDPGSPNGCIPVLRAVVDDVDVVYGAHLAEYGALPATLLETPGACAHVFVTWLTSMQLERMNETEGLGHSYQLRRIGGVRSQGEVVDAAMSYVMVAGVAVLGGGPLGLVSINAPGSSWPRATQRQAWDSLAVDMGCGTDGKTLLDRVLGHAFGGRGSSRTSPPIGLLRHMHLWCTKPSHG